MFLEYEPPGSPLSTARLVLGLPEARQPLRLLVSLPEQVCGRLLVRYLNRIVSRRKGEAVLANPAWAALLARLEACGEDNWLDGDAEEGAMYGEILAYLHKGWLFRLHWWLGYHGPVRLYNRLTSLSQRARRGWADDDLWALDRHITKVLAGGVRQIADLSFGWSDRLWLTHEEWVADLRQLADNLDRLDAHLTEHGALNDPEAQALCDEVFAMLRRAYGHLRLD